MEQLINILFIIGFEYILVKTAYKYHLPDNYQKWRWTLKKDSFVDKVLPEDFCLQCFLVQSSLITSTITVVLQQLPLSHIITYGVIASATVLWMELNENS